MWVLEGRIAGLKVSHLKVGRCYISQKRTTRKSSNIIGLAYRAKSVTARCYILAVGVTPKNAIKTINKIKSVTRNTEYKLLYKLYKYTSLIHVTYIYVLRWCYSYVLAKNVAARWPQECPQTLRAQKPFQSLFFSKSR